MKRIITVLLVAIVSAMPPLFADGISKDLILVPHNILPDVDLTLDLHVRQTNKDAFPDTFDEDLAVQFNEFVTFSYSASQDGYVSLWNIGSSGKVMRLLPNRYKTSMGVKAGEVYRLGEKRQKFGIRVGGPEGMEDVFLLWTKNEADQPISVSDAAFDNVSVYDMEDILSVAQVDHSRWASKRLSFDVSASGKMLFDGISELEKTAGRSMRMKGAKGNVYVLSMGANTGQLRKAGADAVKFDRTVKTLLSNNVYTRLYPDASVKNFRDGMDWLSRSAGPNDTAVIYYSGHGSTLRDQNGDETTDNFDEVFVMSDARGVRAPGEAHVIRDDEFADRVNRFRTNNLIVVLDACFSAGLTKSGLLGGQGRRKFFSAGALGRYASALSASFIGDRQTVNKGVLIYAAEENQSAYEGIRGGVMTHQLVSEMLNRRNKGKSLYSLVQKISRSVNREVRVRPAMSGNTSLLRSLRLAGS